MLSSQIAIVISFKVQTPYAPNIGPLIKCAQHIPTLTYIQGFPQHRPPKQHTPAALTTLSKKKEQ